MSRSILAAFLVVTPVGLACSDAGLSPSDVAGTYDLVSVNGVTIPGSVNLGGVLDVTINEGTLVLTADRNATLSFSSTELGNANVSGTFTLSSDSISVDLSDNLGNTVQGSGPVAGSNITITESDGVVWAFVRR